MLHKHWSALTPSSRNSWPSSMFCSIDFLILFNKTTSVKHNFSVVLFSKPVLLLQMPELPDSAANQETKCYPVLQEDTAQRCSDVLTSANVLLSALRVYSNCAAAGTKVWDLCFSLLFWNFYLQENAWQRDEGAIYLPSTHTMISISVQVNWVVFTLKICLG